MTLPPACPAFGVVSQIPPEEREPRPMANSSRWFCTVCDVAQSSPRFQPACWVCKRPMVAELDYRRPTAPPAPILLGIRSDTT